MSISQSNEQLKHAPEFEQILHDLELGKVRAANLNSASGKWEANTAVKKAILTAFREGILTPMFDVYIDKSTLPPRCFNPEQGVRIVPRGSAIRRGAHVGKGVIIMPPSYINVGAFIDEGTMVDSHVLVGSCAQIGKNVHLSASCQIGGVLEPIGQTPVIIEDGAFLGAGSIIVEGIHVRARAIIAPGVTLSKGVPVYDCVHERMLAPGESIPEGAVVVPGTRPLKSAWAQGQNLQVYCALIIKYRDEKTETALILEETLR